VKGHGDCGEHAEIVPLRTGWNDSKDKMQKTPVHFWVFAFYFFFEFSAFSAVYLLFFPMLPQRKREDKQFLFLAGSKRTHPLFPGKQKPKKIAGCDRIKPIGG
jgi:hypothetical protein